MSLKELIEGLPVHERRLEFKTYPVGDDRLVIEGWLRDERLVSGHQWDGRTREPGVVHFIGVRLLAGGFPLTILDAEAEMPNVPHDLCPTTLDSVKKMIGVPITSGYSERVRELVGGVQGCSHMTHLLVAMGPAALHGFWTQMARKRRPLPKSLEEVPGLSSVVNSCKLWEEGGPLLRKVHAVIEVHKEQNH